MVRQKVSFTVRLPVQDHKDLKRIAEKNIRSMQAQLLKAVEEHIQRERGK